MNIEIFSTRYNIAQKISVINNFLLIIITIIQLLDMFLLGLSAYNLWDCITRLNIGLMFLVVFFSLLGEILIFSARSNTSQSVLDNSFNTCIALCQPDAGYYDNDRIKPGFKKLLYNLCESCFFSKAILGKMLCYEFLKVIMILIVFLFALCANNTNILLFIIQSVLVCTFVTSFIKHLFVYNSLRSIEFNLRSLINGFVENEIVKQQIIIEFVNYESALLWLNTTLNSRIYNKHKKQLTDEWIQFVNRVENNNE